MFENAQPLKTGLLDNYNKLMLVMNKIPQLFDWGIFFSEELGVLSEELSFVLCPCLNKVILTRIRQKSIHASMTNTFIFLGTSVPIVRKRKFVMSSVVAIVS